MNDNDTGIKCILAGIDTLELGVCVDDYLLADNDWNIFEQAKESARSTPYNNDLGGIKFQGKSFRVGRAGKRRYGYILSNDDISIQLNEKAQSGKYFPEVKLIFRSVYLWRDGWQKAVSETLEWLKGWLVVNRITVSRCDLTADYNCFLPMLDPELKQAVTRAVNKRDFLKDANNYGRFTNGKKQSGYVIGGKKIHCRIYDKVLEISRSNKKWFHILWQANGWKPGQSVTRVEFQCRREFLRTIQTDTIEDLGYQLADLWRYLTNDWLTLREIGQDSHRDRWELTEFWKIAQESVGDFGQITGISRLKQKRPSFEKTRSQVRGHMVSLYAMVMASMNGSNFKMVNRQIKNLIKHIIMDPEFEVDVIDRMPRYRGMNS